MVSLADGVGMGKVWTRHHHDSTTLTAPKLVFTGNDATTMAGPSLELVDRRLSGSWLAGFVTCIIYLAYILAIL